MGLGSKKQNMAPFQEIHEQGKSFPPGLGSYEEEGEGEELGSSIVEIDQIQEGIVGCRGLNGRISAESEFLNLSNAAEQMPAWNSNHCTCDSLRSNSKR